MRYFDSYFHAGEYNQHHLSSQNATGVIKSKVVDGNCLSYVREDFFTSP
jgi:hypothetical protein